MPPDPASLLLPDKLREARALHLSGRLDQAQAAYQEILDLHPAHSDALHSLGLLAAQAKRLESAVELISRSIAANSNNALAFYNRGSILIDLGEYAAALASLERSIELRADFYNAHIAQGVALGQLKRWDAALAAFDRALTIREDDPTLHFNRGAVLQELEQWSAAITSYERAIALRPSYAQAHSNRGMALRQLGQWDAALASYERANAVAPDFPEAYSNRGNLLHLLGRYDAALRCYDRAIALNHDFADAHFNRAITLLTLGDFAQGWKEYEWRWKNKSIPLFLAARDFTQPLWLGEVPIDGKTILLHGEQGLGDTIQFCRYAKLVADLGARVILEVTKPLASLLAGLDGISEILVRGTEPPPFDWHCPLMSLPLAFKTTPATIPSPSPYLRADAARTAEWRSRLAEHAGPRLGIVWRGNPHNPNDANRSIPLTEWIPHLPSGWQIVSLQKELTGPDLRTLAEHRHILDFSRDLHDLNDTAALCENMDLVASVDTSVAHLSAALGKKTQIPLPFNPDWRWLLDTARSPWYPTVTLYRQKSPGRWRDLLEQMRADLSSGRQSSLQ
jgi:tetratricopeptide (TPR) repeat protein